MTEPGDEVPRFVRQIKRPEARPFGDNRGVDGSSMDSGINATAPMTPYSKERAKLEEAARARQKLADAKLATGEVIVPTKIETGGNEDIDQEH